MPVACLRVLSSSARLHLVLSYQCGQPPPRHNGIHGRVLSNQLDPPELQLTDRSYLLGVAQKQISKKYASCQLIEKKRSKDVPLVDPVRSNVRNKSDSARKRFFVEHYASF